MTSPGLSGCHSNSATEYTDSNSAHMTSLHSFSIHFNEELVLLALMSHVTIKLDPQMEWQATPTQSYSFYSFDAINLHQVHSSDK